MSKKDRTIVVLTASFKFPMTEDEAYELLKNKNGKVAKKFRKYMNDVLEATAKKCLEEAKVTKKRLEAEALMEVEAKKKKNNCNNFLTNC